MGCEEQQFLRGLSLRLRVAIATALMTERTQLAVLLDDARISIEAVLVDASASRLRIFGVRVRAEMALRAFHAICGDREEESAA